MNFSGPYDASARVGFDENMGRSHRGCVYDHAIVLVNHITNATNLYNYDFIILLRLSACSKS